MFRFLRRFAGFKTTDVLVDARCLEWGRGGVARILLQVLDRWNNEGKIGVTLLFQESVPTDIEQRYPIFDVVILSGPRVFRSSRMVSEQLLIPWILLLLKPRIYFAPWYTAPLLMRNIKLVLGLWDISYSTHPSHYKYIHRFSLGFFSRFSARRAHAIVTCSDFDAMQIKTHYKIEQGKIHVWYISAEEKFFNLLDNGELTIVRNELQLPKRYILSLGVIYNRRHVDVLINAYNRLLQFHPDVGLVVIGRDATSPRRNIKQLCEMSEGDVLYSERIEDRFMPAVYQAAELFYSVSTVDGETLLNKEALAGATPVLTSELLLNAIGGFADTVQDPESEDAVLQALLKHFAQSSEAKRVAKKGRAYVREISWADVTAHSLRLFW